MDDNVGVPRTSEGLSVVPSLSEVSEQIAIAEHIPTEHETTTTAVFHGGEEASSVNVGAHPQCEVQVVKVTNGNVSLSFATPAPSAPHIQATQSTLQPIQEVIADSPAHSTRSSSPNLQDSQAVTTLQQAEQDEMSAGNHHHDEGSPLSRSKYETQGKSPWEGAMNGDVLIVRCRNETAELYKNKLGSGGRGKCIKYQDHWMTPSEFEARCGRASSKDWKRSIRYGGRTLQSLIEDGILVPHAISCTCATCCDDDTLAGPIRLFVPYKRRKRESSQSGSPVLKKSLSLSSENSRREAHGFMMRSVSVDSASGAFASNDDGAVMDTGDLASGLVAVSSGVTSAVPPHTPATPLTPMMSPCPPAMTQAIRPENQTITVTLPVTPLATTDGIADQRRHWWHIEEMVNSLLNTAQQLKGMIEHAKIQAEAAKDAAITQVKLQAEAEKKEALAQARMNSLMQLSRALNDARLEKEAAVAQAVAHAKAEKMEAAADERQEQLIKSLNGGEGEITMEEAPAVAEEVEKNGVE